MSKGYFMSCIYIFLENKLQFLKGKPEIFRFQKFVDNHEQMLKITKKTNLCSVSQESDNTVNTAAGSKWDASFN